MLPILTLLYLAALALILAGLFLLMLPKSWGLLLVWGASVGYWGWQYFLRPDPRFWVFATSVTALTALAFFSEWLGKKLDLRTRWVSQQTLWGAIIGSLIGLFLFNRLEMMLLGIFAGAAIAESKSGPQAAIRQGAAAFLAILGGDGFRILAAAAIASQFLAYH